MEPKLQIILFQPEIPQNTGNVGRLCAFTGARLHLVGPLGFSLDDRYLRRSGMDYWKHLDVKVHESWEAFRDGPDFPERIWLFTTHARQSYWSATFQQGDALLFGNEGHGCPGWLHEEIGDTHRITLPRFNEQPLRSLNLATSVGIAAYEAMRQIALPGAP
ncbi:tRNA (cytidine(34)-2'-O)-methyltransferase [Puniceicoccales bacterium CK1056]|uniref:Putative tRNA (cytidine(34)-2'-O)-methyltransferase n=1 Tax=Oceanipulchritudo coccoides TaxID=2706888 RepID=A0A6B2LX36_9BACT|nr:tRNA (cytidine(34)-2'-O)-methyltransferase [Oceanipulchritudo coccoides]NDV61051.1 tRNA (cytidine(34)-2'-O)-methyltransferase [Oceanipulchritudo coccoides]